MVHRDATINSLTLIKRLADNGELYVWGWNYYGQLGIGNAGPESQLEPGIMSFLSLLILFFSFRNPASKSLTIIFTVKVREMDDYIVLQVACGEQHTIALVTSRA